MKVGIVTQARTTSKRLPGKVLLPLGGVTVLELHLRRLLASGLPVVVATTSNAVDDPIDEIASTLGCGVFRGDEADVLSRYTGAVEAFGLEGLVRVTSDCPLIDGSLVADAVALWAAAENLGLYLSNTQVRTYPRGFDLEVFSAVALRRAADNAVARHQREHVTPYLYDGSDRFIQFQTLERSRDGAEQFRVTLDTSDDYAFLQELLAEPGVATASAEDIIRILQARPELSRLNSHVHQKELNEK